MAKAVSHTTVADATFSAAGVTAWDATHTLTDIAALSANTFTALQTITQATANAGILASTGYSLTGSDATSMIDLAGTWNTTGTPTAIKLDITNTASNAASLLMDLKAGGTSVMQVTAAGKILAGTAVPAYSFAADPDSGLRYSNRPIMYEGTKQVMQFDRNWVRLADRLGIGDPAAEDSFTLYHDHSVMGANSLQFSGTATASVAAGAITSRTVINKAITGISDATGTATFTVTIPNAAHSGSLKVTLVGSLGAGGAIGANEASATIAYDIAITRTAGVATVATISAAYGSAASAVAGAATVTVTAVVSGMTGAVSATQTFTVNVTITKSGGSSDNHTCLCFGELLNANVTGVTIA